MSPSWTEILPESLHDDFRRQILERVNAEIMELLLDDEFCVPDDAAVEAKYTEQYLSLFVAGRWPPRTGGVAADQTARHQKWRCPNCEDRNFSTLTTCKKCGDPKPVGNYEEPVVRQVMKQIFAQPAPRVLPTVASAAPALTWTCLECSYANNQSKSTECMQCAHSRDPMKRDSWPKEIADFSTRMRLRKEVFQRLVTAFGVDDPFAASHITHGTFVQAIECVQRRVLEEYNDGGLVV
jgi:hypothetical protein